MSRAIRSGEDAGAWAAVAPGRDAAKAAVTARVCVKRRRFMMDVIWPPARAGPPSSGRELLLVPGHEEVARRGSRVTSGKHLHRLGEARHPAQGPAPVGPRAHQHPAPDRRSVLPHDDGARPAGVTASRTASDGTLAISYVGPPPKLRPFGQGREQHARPASRALRVPGRERAAVQRQRAAAMRARLNTQPSSRTRSAAANAPAVRATGRTPCRAPRPGTPRARARATFARPRPATRGSTGTCAAEPRRWLHGRPGRRRARGVAANRPRACRSRPQHGTLGRASDSNPCESAGHRSRAAARRSCGRRRGAREQEIRRKRRAPGSGAATTRTGRVPARGRAQQRRLMTAATARAAG